MQGLPTEPPWTDGAGELGVPAGWQFTHLAAADSVGGSVVALLLVWMVYRLAMPILIERMRA